MYIYFALRDAATFLRNFNARQKTVEQNEWKLAAKHAYLHAKLRLLITLENMFNSPQSKPVLLFLILCPTALNEHGRKFKNSTFLYDSMFAFYVNFNTLSNHGFLSR